MRILALIEGQRSPMRTLMLEWYLEIPRIRLPIYLCLKRFKSDEMRVGKYPGLTSVQRSRDDKSFKQTAFSERIQSSMKSSNRTQSKEIHSSTDLVGDSYHPPNLWRSVFLCFGFYWSFSWKTESVHWTQSVWNFCRPYYVVRMWDLDTFRLSFRHSWIFSGRDI